MVSSANSRQRLLDAAVELIRTDPDRNVSVRDICARAGVQLPTLYHFFESKRGLLDAVAQVGYERARQLLTLTSDAAARGLLVVTAEEAAARWSAAMTGVIMHLVSSGAPGAGSRDPRRRPRGRPPARLGAAARGGIVAAREVARPPRRHRTLSDGDPRRSLIQRSL